MGRRRVGDRQTRHQKGFGKYNPDRGREDPLPARGGTPVVSQESSDSACQARSWAGFLSHTENEQRNLE